MPLSSLPRARVPSEGMQESELSSRKTGMFPKSHLDLRLSVPVAAFNGITELVRLILGGCQLQNKQGEFVSQD